MGRPALPLETPLVTRFVHGSIWNQHTKLAQYVWGKPTDVQVYLFQNVQVLEATTSSIIA